MSKRSSDNQPNLSGPTNTAATGEDRKTPAQKIAEDQIRRGVSLRVNLRYITEHDWGYAIGLQPVVRYTLLSSGQTLVIELLDPNPEYEECGEPFQSILMVDLEKDELDLIDEIEAISDHLNNHQDRFENPCECHPKERCGACHLRHQPCFSVEGFELKTVPSGYTCSGPLYEEICAIVTAGGLECDYESEGHSCWSWRGSEALWVRQVYDQVDVEFNDWVIDVLLYEVGQACACPIISFREPDEFGLLCSQIVSAFPRKETELVGNMSVDYPTEGGVQ